MPEINKEMKVADPVAYIDVNQSVNEIVLRYPQSLRVFHKYGIDSCCGGIHPIKKAALAHGIDLEKIVTDILNEIKI